MIDSELVMSIEIFEVWDKTKLLGCEVITHDEEGNKVNYWFYDKKSLKDGFRDIVRGI